MSPPKSSLALYSSQEPAQDVDTVLQSSHTFARELSFVPGTVIRLESCQLPMGVKRAGFEFSLVSFPAIEQVLQVTKHIKKPTRPFCLGG